MIKKMKTMLESLLMFFAMILLVGCGNNSDSQTIGPVSENLEYYRGSYYVFGDNRDDSLKYYYSVGGIGTCTDKDIVIPSEYNGLPVRAIASNAFEECDSLTSITIPDSVSYIDEATFYGCDNLNNIVIPYSVTRICESAFEGCESLTNITLYKSIEFIDFHAFNGCKSLSVIYYGGAISEWKDIIKERQNISQEITVYCTDGTLKYTFE